VRAELTQALAVIQDVRTEVQVPPIANRGSTPACKLGLRKTEAQSFQMADKLRDDEPSIEVVPSRSRRELVIARWMMQPGR